MKFEFKGVLQILTRLNAARTSHSGMRPARDWALGMLIVLPVFVLAVLYAGYRFLEVKSQMQHPAPVSIETAEYRYEWVDEALTIYAEKRRVFERAVGAPFGSVVAPEPSVAEEEGEGVE